MKSKIEASDSTATQLFDDNLKQTCYHQAGASDANAS